MNSRSVFIAYSHGDQAWEVKVESHLRVLQQALPEIEVWDDRRIGAGDDWLHEIERAIDRARVAILLISEKFLTSSFITQKEVPRLLSRRASDSLTIIPLLVRACAWQTVPWLRTLQVRPRDGRPLAALRLRADEALANLATEVAATFEVVTGPGRSAPASPASPPSKFDAPRTFPGGGTLPLPCFFASVSGAAKNIWSPLDHLRVLVSTGFPCFLASTYDFAAANRPDRLEMGTLLAAAMEKGQIVLLDSGLYERKWLRDRNWSRARFLSTLAGLPCHLSFSYDRIGGTRGPTTAAEIVAQVIGDRRRAELKSIFPIVHGDPSSLPTLTGDVARLLESDIVAVAERELGDGILAGATNMLALRSALNSTGRYRLIHLLGTGNPLSLLIYSACGADSFDGLDWCQTVADHDGKRLYHSQHLDLFTDQSNYAKDPGLTYAARMLGHNLAFYRQWMAELQQHRSTGTLGQLLVKYLPEPFSKKLLLLLNPEGSK